MKISEIFVSLAGEGPDTGIPMIFIRLQGCNMSCPWCDSKYTWEENGELLDIDELMTRIKNVDTYCSNRVYLTGGEPLTQEQEVGELVKRLRASGYTITIATNGTLPKPSWWKKVLWDVDCKCPSSSASIFNWSWANIGRKNRLKFVVADENDLKFVEDMLPNLYRFHRSLRPTLLVSPMVPISSSLSNAPWFQTVWNFCIRYNLRYSLQVHKVVWGNERKR